MNSVKIFAVASFHEKSSGNQKIKLDTVNFNNIDTRKIYILISIKTIHFITLLTTFNLKQNNS